MLDLSLSTIFLFKKNLIQLLFNKNHAAYWYLDIERLLSNKITVGILKPTQYLKNEQ